MRNEKLLITNPKSNNSEVMRNKQIGEIGKILTEYEDCGDCNNCPYHECCGEERLATELYNAGYRKQSEGEWVIKSEIYKFIDDVDEELFVECSICQRRFNVPYELDDEKIFKYAREHYPYCNCGAKMKGGAECL